jgi:DNA-binding PadR family transcriptional regulator
VPTPRLTPTSYLVLGLIRVTGEATPYQLKQEVATGLGDLWSVPHAQIYREPGRLAASGLLTERVEPGGRRRRLYRLTDAGERALDTWLADPRTDFTELRDPGLLKLFLGADPRALAAGQVEIHQAQLERYESIHEVAGPELPEGVRLALEAGIGHEREWVRFWRSVMRPPA